VAPHFQISVYHEDGVFDRGPTLDDARGARAIAAFIQRPERAAAIRGGLAHFSGLPLVDLRGDAAVVTSSERYLLTVMRYIELNPVRAISAAETTPR